MTQKTIKKIFIVAGEHSGDLLGGKLINALKSHLGNEIQFAGVGGEKMQEEGFESLFPIADIAVMGPVDIAKALPRLTNRVRMTVEAALEFRPDVLIIIDSPEFTHRVAKRVRKALPSCPVIDYVSPSVWAWRPGRARKMKAYIDHVLALLPFEPDVHKKLGGPDCTYVGHPMIEKLDWMRGQDPEALRHKLQLKEGLPVLVVLPGSRPNEIKRLMQPFGETVKHLIDALGPVEVILPVVSSVRGLIEQGLADWPVKPHFIENEAEKFASFSLADAALAASGTVSLELALCGTPMVIAYKADLVVSLIKRWLINVPSVVLPNLILEDNIFPEFLQEQCRSENIFKALLPLMTDTTERGVQKQGLEKLRSKMKLEHITPSQSAAKVILKYL